MALAGKVEKDVELKASADKFYKVFSSQAHHVTTASDSMHEVEVLEGDWETAGSLKLWKYTIDGKPEILKEKVHLDDAKKEIIFTIVEGHILEQYKSFKTILQVVPVGEGGTVKVIIEYEKLNPNDPPPTKYMDFVVSVIKDVDAHLLKA